MSSQVRLNVVLAASYLVYAAVAATLLILVALMGSQAASGMMEASLVLAIAVTSPLPMLLISIAFWRDSRYAVLFAFAVALVQACAYAAQSHIVGGKPIATLDVMRTALFYVCNAQTFYLPGSLFLAPLSALVLVGRRKMNRASQ